jgi:LysM repeat protein
MKFQTLLFLSLPLGLLLFSPLQAQENKHKVKTGETLSQLARKYKTTVDELMRLNPDAAKGLKIGALLQLPGAAEEPGSGAKQVVGSDKLHKVVSGESLSRIAKKYKVSVADLENWNNMSAKDLKAGQELRVSAPSGVDAAVSAPKVQVKEEKMPEPPAGGTHVVYKGETLSSIAQKEGTTVAELKKLNQLKKDQLNLGQVLILPAKESLQAAEKPVSAKEIKKSPEPAPKKEVPAKAEIVPAETSSSVLAITASSQVNEIPTRQEEKSINNTPSTQAGIREVNNTLGYTRVVETGFAEAIEGDGNSKKHLCLHKSAPVGSILQVKNEVNGQSVFVKVIGKLPETGSNEKIIIRISRQAYERLMASGKRFPVEVSYPEAQP